MPTTKKGTKRSGKKTTTKKKKPTGSSGKSGASSRTVSRKKTTKKAAGRATRKKAGVRGSRARRPDKGSDSGSSVPDGVNADAAQRFNDPIGSIIRTRTAPARTGNTKSVAKRREEAWERLGVDKDIVERVPAISHLLDMSIGQDLAIEYLRGSADPISRKWLEAYDSLPKTYRELLPIEAFCVAIGVEPKKLLGLIVEETVDGSGEVSRMLAAFAHPEVVKSTVANAMLPGSEGARDRDMLHKHQGFVPTNKNQVVNIGELHGGVGNDNRKQIANVSVGELQDMEDDVLQIGDRFNTEVLGENDEDNPVPDIEVDAEVVEAEMVED